jgi:hypothetical protein
MAAFWVEMGMAYLEINKLPCLHEFDIPKGINVYSILVLSRVAMFYDTTKQKFEFIHFEMP